MSNARWRHQAACDRFSYSNDVSIVINLWRLSVSLDLIIVKLPMHRCCYTSSVCHMFCSSAQHGREKKPEILVAESTRESCSPIQPFILILFLHCLKLLSKPRAAISSEIRSYTFLLRRIPSKLALYFDISSNVNNGGDFVVRPIYVYWFFVSPLSV